MKLLSIFLSIGVMAIVALNSADAVVKDNFNRPSTFGHKNKLTTRRPNHFGPTSRWTPKKATRPGAYDRKWDKTPKPLNRGSAAKKLVGSTRKYPHHYDMPTPKPKW